MQHPPTRSFHILKNPVLLIPVLFVVVCGLFFSPRISFAGPEEDYEAARQSYYQVLDSPTAKLDRNNWLRTIRLFQTVIDRHPSSYQAYKAAFTQGLLYLELHKLSGDVVDQKKAVHYFGQVVDRFAPGRLTDDALLHRAVLYKRLGELEKARISLKRILNDYADGDQADSARRELSALLEKDEKPIAPPKTQGGIKTADSVPEKNTKPANTTGPVRLFDLGYQNGKEKATVTLRAGGQVKFSQQRLENPDRVQVSFENGSWDPAMPKVVTLDPGILTHVEPRAGENGGSLLLVEMTGGGPVSVTTRTSGGQFLLEFEAIPEAPSQSAETLPEIPPVAQGNDKNLPPLVVLDPGHGGKDEGAKGRTGILEKQVNLEIAKRVQRLLEKRYKYRVVLTRTKDTFIELKDRGDMANKLNADLFVSIHANAAPRKSARGIETYFLGAGAGDRALETAARENGELVGSVEDDEVQQILASLLSTTKINESARLAADVQKRLVRIMPKKFSRVLDLGVKEGPFYVLHRTNMPSILVEVGFLTNQYEERRLQNTGYQYWLAESIAQGIHRFIQEKGPSI